MKLSWTLPLALVVPSTWAAVDERSVLLEFFQQTGGDSWNENSGWVDNSGDICDWYGVICDSDDLGLDGRRRLDDDAQVLGIYLPGNYLSGRTPSSLWTLPALIAIDFSGNSQLDVNFVGLEKEDASPLAVLRLPATATTSVTDLAGAAATLQELELSENNFDSQFPTELLALTKLSVLKLSECGLVGTIPDSIRSMSALRELNMHKNDLTGTMPSGLSKLVHLRHLTFSQNQLHGTIPSFVSDYLLLKELWLLDNDFTGTLPSLNQAPDLHKINLQDNELTGTIPTDFLDATATSLSQDQIIVNLKGNMLTGVIPSELDNLEDRYVLWLIADNQFTDYSDSFCDNSLWNNGYIAEYDCRGFLCPPETYSRHGFQTNDTACQPCDSAEYYGTTSCFGHNDYTALKEIYDELDGDNWVNNTNWLTDDDVCTWHGIVCWEVEGTDTGRVRKLLLPNNGLVGTAPSTIYSLHDLTTIDLSHNDIVLPFDNLDQSPHIISINVARTNTKDYDGIEGASTYFQELYADHTPISGTFPEEILNMNKVTVLSFQECGISGPLPEGLFNLVNLEEIYLSNNALTGTIPDQFDVFPYLTTVSLAKNKLHGTIPTTFDDAPSLIAVSLEDQVTKGGGITGALHAFDTTTTLRSLRLSNNKLEGDLPEDLLASLEGDLPVTLDLANNYITGSVHAAYSRFSKINLFLEGNFISKIESSLCKLSDWMSGNVAEYGCDAILCPAGTTGSRRQYLGENTCLTCEESGLSAAYMGQSVCGTDPTANLTTRDTLELLFDSCGGSNWASQDYWKTDTSICDWYGISCDESGSVTAIQLGGNQLTGTFPTAIYKLPTLRSLKLYSNKIHFSFDGAENAENLQTLVLDDVGLKSLVGVGSIRTLTELNVASNNLGGTIPEEISRLVSLKTVDISGNDFSGVLPSALKNMASLTTFKAANNKLSGPIYSFASNANMLYLDVSNNKLTGTIPSELLASATDSEKVVLDISSNRLSGTMPGDLTHLHKLAIQAGGNHFTAIDDALCENLAWNDYDVERYGCDGILCPAGTWNSRGRQSSDESPCVDCNKAKYMGATACSSGASSPTLGLGALLLGLWLFFA
eukprot:Nitzschia sp. Nitz4//scaffold6_size259037//65754//69050//NITZ4_001056-RA/size259037-processed-gene-0.63-mRNA-1//-1//CDS//3329556839//2896//frame0